jgi:uncharacterized protein YbjT (DUF2867 family)
MADSGRKTIVVTGATGLQGGAVTRHLLSEGWHVRGLTRDVASKQAQALAATGAEVVQGDMGDPASLRPVFEGAYGVYSVQNPYIGGPEAEVTQGKNVADVARESDVQHLVYGSAGFGTKGTGVPSWETKLQVEEHIKAIGLPVTIVRPMALMEIMTHKKFYPGVGAWRVMPALMGRSRKLGWLCADDLGEVVGKAFADPQRFLGREMSLSSDIQSLAQCRAIYREVMGKNPSSFPMPVWLFRRFGFMGKDLLAMWTWLRTAEIPLDTAPTREIHPDALTVRDWLARQKAVTPISSGYRGPAV